ncbi:MAG: Ig-like domain-containing protein [Bacteroidales bacterium]|nr:Ig-like domain-containing protein [Bacteroidales bacterium]
MKKTFIYIAMVAIACTAFIACDKDNGESAVSVTSVELNFTQDTLIVGETLQLYRTLLPSDATNKTVTWTSSDDAIATVNNNGLVTAVTKGDATITVTTEDGNKTATCIITVISKVLTWDAGQWETASFATDSTWIVGNQEWSDVVQVTGCDKTDYQGTGAESGTYNADCRSNPGQKGHLFSYEMIAQFGDVLCPEGWRVPTNEDFIALGSTFGEFTLNDSMYLVNNYLGTWGATTSGECTATGVLRYQEDDATNAHRDASYWSQSPNTGGTAAMAGHKFHLRINTKFLDPKALTVKSTGIALRCIKE